MLSLLQADTPKQIDAARELFLEYRERLGIDLCFQGFEAEVKGLPGDYVPPGGRLLLALHDGEPVGCIALHVFQGRSCELKRLFVRPSARGLGAGRALVAAAIAAARAIGYAEMRLDTLPSMVAAQRLYESFGFVDIAPYRDNPVPGARYLALDLERA